MDTIMGHTILAALLAASVFTDLRERRIPNKITVTACLAAVAVSCGQSGVDGLLHSLVGMFAGFAVMSLPWTLGGVGGGDVKMMAAVGAIVGWRLALASFVFTAIAGGVIVLFIHIVLWLDKSSSEIKIDWSGKRATEKPKAIPYACAIAIGALAAVVLDKLIIF